MAKKLGFGTMRLPLQSDGQKTNMYYLRARTDHGLASDCLECGLCESNCPQHIDIRSWLKKFAELYEG